MKWWNKRCPLPDIFSFFNCNNDFRSVLLFSPKKCPLSFNQNPRSVLKKLSKFKRFGKTHPATKTFQALRIAVNGELTALIKAMDELPKILGPGGRLLVITFHSLEDRIVKQKFKEIAQNSNYTLITKKPITADAGEIKRNPRSRSAKLRVAEKIGNTE